MQQWHALHHPHFYILVKRNVPGFSYFLKKIVKVLCYILSFPSMSSSYPSFFLKEIFVDDTGCLPLLFSCSAFWHCCHLTRWGFWRFCVPAAGLWELCSAIFLASCFLPSGLSGVFGCKPQLPVELQEALPHGPALQQPVQQTPGCWDIPELVQSCRLVQLLPFPFFIDSVLTSSLVVMDFVQLRR